MKRSFRSCAIAAGGGDAEQARGICDIFLAETRRELELIRELGEMLDQGAVPERGRPMCRALAAAAAEREEMISRLAVYAADSDEVIGTPV